MSLPAAFITVIILWSTTPLAIKWSSETWGFLFSVTGRMLVGTLMCVALMLVLRKKLPLHRKALFTYLAAGTGIFGAMMLVYWAAQFITSGLVAVLFGLTPIATAILAAIWLNETSLTPGKMIGAVLGLLGLVEIYAADINGVSIAWQGVAGVLLSVVIHASSSVWVKRIGEKLPALTITTGGLLVAMPLYLFTWLMFDGDLPTRWPVRDVSALLYLGIMGSVLGFTLYYYVLKHVEANRVALLTLVTPVLALLFGNVLNHEAINIEIWIGTILILSGLSINQWGDGVVTRLKLIRIWMLNYF